MQKGSVAVGNTVWRRGNRLRGRFAVLVGCLLVMVPCGLTHETGASLLKLREHDGSLTGTWAIDLEDLARRFSLDPDGDHRVTVDEWNRRLPVIRDDLNRSLDILVDGTDAAVRIDTREGDANRPILSETVLFDVALSAPAPKLTLEIRYELFFDALPDHRGLAVVTVGGRGYTALFDASHRREVIDLDVRGPSREFARFCREGVWHIWIGFDHILFLVILMLPAVLVYDPAAAAWVGGGKRFRESLLNGVGIVTSFTAAHSITLSLMALGLIAVPSGLTEPAIALSIVVCGINNVRPFMTRRLWLFAFAFGLIHGLGFANALIELELPRQMEVVALIGFNLGVELGQLAIVAVIFPLVFAGSKRRFYRRWVLNGGSLAVALVAGYWFVQRIL